MNGVPALRPQFPDYGNVLARGAAIKGAESRNVLTQMQIQDYPEDRNWLRKQRGFEEKDRVLAAQKAKADRVVATAKEKRETEKHLSDMDAAAINKEIKVTEQVMKWLATVENVSDYALFREGMIKKGGVPPGTFMDPTNFIRADGTPDEEAFDQYRDSILMSGKDRVDLSLAAMKKKGPILGERQAQFDAEGKLIVKGAKYGTPKEEGPKKEYTVQQQIDDAVAFYNFKIRTLLDDFGDVKEGKEEEYDKLTDSLAKDQRAILADKKPSYLREEATMQRKPGETIVDYLKRIK